MDFFSSVSCTCEQMNGLEHRTEHRSMNKTHNIYNDFFFVNLLAIVGHCCSLVFCKSSSKFLQSYFSQANRVMVFFVCVRETGMHSRSIWGDRCRFLAHLRIFESELSCRRLSFFKITTVFFVGPFIYNAGFKYYPIVFLLRIQYFLAPHRRATFLLIFQFSLQL